ncbi:MAG: RebB family R body protein [Opitutae bacterium]|nr:RebB family R body protein [Opitutae bacterium]
MAYPTAVNSQITDAVTQTNLRVGGDVPAMTRGNLAPATATAPVNATTAPQLGTVNVGGQSRVKYSDFSPRFQAVLHLIPGGPQWLEWALHSSGSAFNADDEVQLLSQIQFALHGSRVAVFQSAGLRLAPAMLLVLSTADFASIVSSLETGQLTPAAQAALNAHSFQTEANFAKLDQVLAALGVAGQISLHSSNLSDQVCLYELLVAQNSLSSDNNLNIAAANFAATVAQNATDFGAAFAFYLAAAAAQPGGDHQHIPALWSGLTPIALNYLRCPSVPGDANIAEVENILSAFFNQWPFLGFRTLGSAIYHCGTHSGIDLSQPIIPSNAADLIGAYMLRAQRALYGQRIRSMRCGQDGITRWFQFDNSDGTGCIQLDDEGCLTLHTFTPR